MKCSPWFLIGYYMINFISGLQDIPWINPGRRAQTPYDPSGRWAMGIRGTAARARVAGVVREAFSFGPPPPPFI